MQYPYRGVTRDPELTPRELDVLRLLVRGQSTKEIAASLTIAFKTAACHRMRIMDKLGVHNVAGLTRYAIQKGIIDIFGQSGNTQELDHLNAVLELARTEYMSAMEAYQVFLTERADLGTGNPDGITGAARLHRDEMFASQKYRAALQNLANFVTGRSSSGVRNGQPDQDF